MKLDLSKLTDAVTLVAGLASNGAALAAANVALLADAKASQDAVDTLTAALIAATTSPAGAVGLAAVAAAVAPAAAPVAPVAPVTASQAPVASPPVAPLTVDELNAKIAASNAAAAPAVS